MGIPLTGDRAGPGKETIMLVLSRRLNQKILLPGVNTSVQVVSIKGNVVRLGIEAPPGLTVLREELVRDAAAGPPDGFPVPGGRSAPEPVADRALLAHLEGALAELALVSARQRAALPADSAAALSRAEKELQAVRRRLAGPADAAPRGGTRDRRGTRALLVEDNPNERELLATFLRLAGLSVDTAGDGADALGYLASHPRPDVVLLDMGMPRCDGPTAVRAIRHDPALADLKIVAVSGHTAEEYDLPQGPSGVDRWFQKPVDPATLVRELERELTRGGR
jgi:carbon storage regulator CsrA